MGHLELGAVREGNMRATASEGTRAWGIRSLTTLVGVFSVGTRAWGIRSLTTLVGVFRSHGRLKIERPLRYIDETLRNGRAFTNRDAFRQGLASLRDTHAMQRPHP